MAGSVKIRDGYSISDSGIIHYADRNMPWAEADEKAGFRLDRRKAWAFIDGELCDLISWSSACSGCNIELGATHGFGCSECGYHGVVRNSEWVPYSPPPRIARAALSTPDAHAQSKESRK